MSDINNLRAIRKSLGMTIEHLAHLCGTSKSQIWGMEQENANPGIRMATLVAERLGKTVEYVWQVELPPPLPTERELIMHAINRYERPPAGRLAHVEALFGVSGKIAERICLKYGFDPDEEVK